MLQHVTNWKAIILFAYGNHQLQTSLLWTLLDAQRTSFQIKEVDVRLFQLGNKALIPQLKEAKNIVLYLN